VWGCRAVRVSCRRKPPLFMEKPSLSFSEAPEGESRAIRLYRRTVSATTGCLRVQRRYSKKKATMVTLPKKQFSVDSDTLYLYLETHIFPSRHGSVYWFPSGHKFCSAFRPIYFVFLYISQAKWENIIYWRIKLSFDINHYLKLRDNWDVQ
jgi:hypothetical protein